MKLQPKFVSGVHSPVGMGALPRAVWVGAAAKANFANGLRFIQNSQVFLRRGDATNAANNINAGYQAAGVAAPKFAFNGRSNAQISAQLQTAIMNAYLGQPKSTGVNTATKLANPGTRIIGGVGAPRSVGVGMVDPVGSIFTALKNAFAYAAKKNSASLGANYITAPAGTPVNWNNGRRFIQIAQTYLNQNNVESAFVNMLAGYGAAYGPAYVQGAWTYAQAVSKLGVAGTKAAIAEFIKAYGTPGIYSSIDIGMNTKGNPANAGAYALPG
jgi:hypothetical protein